MILYDDGHNGGGYVGVPVVGVSVCDSAGAHVNLYDGVNDS